MKIPFQQRIPEVNEAESTEEWHKGLSLSTRNTCIALGRLWKTRAIRAKISL